MALKVLALVNAIIPLTVTWICQQQPSSTLLQQCPGIVFNLHVNPAQDLLPQLFRGHDALLFTSRYEAWGLPVLEGMASGLAVVTTDCLGVRDFVVDGVNAMMANVQV